VCTLKTKGLRTLLQINPTPLQNVKIQHRIQGAQSMSGFVPLNEHKKEEKLGFWGDLGYGEKKRKKLEMRVMGVNGRPAEVLRRRGDVVVAVEWCLGGGIWILGSLGEER
jgi:hypothetical protein